MSSCWSASIWDQGAVSFTVLPICIVTAALLQGGETAFRRPGAGDSCQASDGDHTRTWVMLRSAEAITEFCSRVLLIESAVLVGPHC